MPLTIATITPAEIARVFDWYIADLPQNTFQQEIHRRGTYVLSRSSLSDREIFHILLTMPIGSVPCE